MECGVDTKNDSSFLCYKKSCR